MSGYIFQTRSELTSAVNEWVTNQSNATLIYGEINTWDVSNITDFSYLFENQTNFNSDISNWDVSSGTDFSYMFSEASAFNQNIGDWDVSNGTNFHAVFLCYGDSILIKILGDGM